MSVQAPVQLRLQVAPLLQAKTVPSCALKVQVAPLEQASWALLPTVRLQLAVLEHATTALAPAAKTYAGLDGVTALFLTYASLLVVLSAGVAALGADRFALSFTVVFAIAYASWIAGSYVYIAAATPAEQLQDPE